MASDQLVYIISRDDDDGTNTLIVTKDPKLADYWEKAFNTYRKAWHDNVRVESYSLTSEEPKIFTLYRWSTATGLTEWNLVHQGEGEVSGVSGRIDGEHEKIVIVEGACQLTVRRVYDELLGIKDREEFYDTIRKYRATCGHPS